MNIISDVYSEILVTAQAQSNRRSPKGTHLNGGPHVVTWPDHEGLRDCLPRRESQLARGACSGEIMSLLSAAVPISGGNAGRSGLYLLSPEARVLSVIIGNSDVMVKDIPLVTGISFRSCYEIICMLSALGIIEKRTHPSDRRAFKLSVNKVKLCEHFCGCTSP